MGENGKRMMVFAGTSNPDLAEGVARHLGVELGNVKIRKFANGEIYVRYLESVRGADVFIVQSISAPVNDTLMELLIMVDAAKRASARTKDAGWPAILCMLPDRFLHSLGNRERQGGLGKLSLAGAVAAKLISRPDDSLRVFAH